MTKSNINTAKWMLWKEWEPDEYLAVDVKTYTGSTYRQAFVNRHGDLMSSDGRNKLSEPLMWRYSI